MRPARPWQRAQISISRADALGAAAHGVAGGGDRRPGHAPALVERERQALARRQRLPVALTVRPGDVVRPGAVTGFAGHVDLRPRRAEGPRRGVEVLAQVGRVALGALEVPVLADAGPVQRIAGPDVLAGVEVEPALSALRLRARVPGDGQRLLAAARKLDQVLLQRAHAERVGDLVVGELPVRAVGVDEVPAVAAEEGRRDPGVGELGIGEIAEHGSLVGRLHGEVVVRSQPRGLLRRVAAGAGAAADVAGLGNRGGGHRRRRRVALRPERDAGDAHEDEHRDARDQDLAGCACRRAAAVRARRRRRWQRCCLRCRFARNPAGIGRLLPGHCVVIRQV